MLGLIGEVISLRSFSSLWYWAAILVYWIWATGRVLGISFGLVRRAHGDAQAMQLLELLFAAQVDHWLSVWSRYQLLWVAAGCAIMVGLARLAFHYDIEMAQALWFLVLPYMHLMILNLRTALRCGVEMPLGEALISFMYRRRIVSQLIGFVYIFVTSAFAFFYLLTHAYFG